MELKATLGTAIRSALGDRTQAQVAAMIDVDQPTVSDWINDKRRPSLEQMAAIEEACDRPRGWLLRQVGYLDDCVTFEDVVANDRKLSDSDRKAIGGLYLVLVGDSPEGS